MKTKAKIVIGVVLVVLTLIGLASMFLPSLSRAREFSVRTAARIGLQDPELAAPPGSLPDIEEELWVIKRSETAQTVAPSDAPPCGMLTAKHLTGSIEVPLPLAHTDVKAWIAGYIATVRVRQQYHNPFDEKIEAVYVFPLPQNAAINEFVMTIGERRIRGIIREREEAERIYREARSQGYLASLMTQERPNIFTQSVANIEPNKNIDIEIRYFHTLSHLDGWYEFVFPMVVGPRFNPPGQTDGVGAVARQHSGLSGQATEVPYLRPKERSGHDISLTVEIDAGVTIEEAVCPSHAVAMKSQTPHRTQVSLSPLDAIPNKDFVLRYRVAGDQIKSALLVQQEDDLNYFTLMIHPPMRLTSLPRSPMEMIFVLDCSGSMSGRPIEQAKLAIERGIKQLQPDDTFQIIRFSNNASQLGDKPLVATKSNVHRGIEYLRSLHGSGGTMMIEGIRAALDFPHDARRLRFVSFMTDGYIGNEAQILGEVHKRLGSSRIFSFGVGSSPNRYLLSRMAKLGNGAVAYVALDDHAGKVMDLFFERISHPAMTEINIDWDGVEVTDVFPERIPDLFVGRPVVVTGRSRGALPNTIQISGRVGDQERVIPVSIDSASNVSSHKGIASVWARTKIANLHDRSTWQPHANLTEQIRQVALEYGLVSAYTAFVSVDSSARSAGDHGTTVKVAVPVPEGVRYETTVIDP
jgi:Ca-activated chloride channel homolog